MSQAIHKPIKRESQWHTTVTKWMRYTFFALITLFAIGLYLSLISYHPNDAAWTSAVQNQTIHNWMGIQGAYYSDITLTLFDRVAWIIPLILILYSYQLIINRKIMTLNVPKLSVRLLGILFFIIAFSTLLDLSSASGGVVGKGISNFATIFFNQITNTLFQLFNSEVTALDIGLFAQRLAQIFFIIIALIALRFAIGSGPIAWSDYVGEHLLSLFYRLRGMAPRLPKKEGDALSSVEHLMEKPKTPIKEADRDETITASMVDEQEPTQHTNDPAIKADPELVSDLIKNLEEKQRQNSADESVNQLNASSTKNSASNQWDTPLNEPSIKRAPTANQATANFLKNHRSNQTQAHLADQHHHTDNHDNAMHANDRAESNLHNSENASNSAFDNPDFTHKILELNEWANSDSTQQKSEPSFDSLVKEQAESLKQTFSTSRSLFGRTKEDFENIQKSAKRRIPIERRENRPTRIVTEEAPHYPSQKDDAILPNDGSIATDYPSQSHVYNDPVSFSASKNDENVAPTPIDNDIYDDNDYMDNFSALDEPSISLTSNDHHFLMDEPEESQEEDAPFDPIKNLLDFPFGDPKPTAKSSFDDLQISDESTEPIINFIDDSVEEDSPTIQFIEEPENAITPPLSVNFDDEIEDEINAPSGKIEPTMPLEDQQWYDPQAENISNNPLNEPFEDHFNALESNEGNYNAFDNTSYHYSNDPDDLEEENHYEEAYASINMTLDAPPYSYPNEESTLPFGSSPNVTSRMDSHQQPSIEPTIQTKVTPSFNQPVEPAPEPEERYEDIYEKYPMYGRLPGLDLLGNPPPKQNQYDDEELQNFASLIEEQLKHYNIEVSVAKIEPGPVITRFRLELAPGVKVAQINNLSRDIARALSVTNVRVQDIIPGTPYVGLEVPNAQREIVYFKEGLFSKEYREAKHPLTMILGQDISGQEVIANLGKMPHLLVAGTTGSGKSVGINTMLLSLLFKARPDELRLILIDPKMLELSVYNDIPHLLAPVVTDMKESANALRWCVAEMECRYQLMSELKTRNIAGYNEKVKRAIKAGEPLQNPLWNQSAESSEFAREQTLEPMPYIVVVIDEFADMMMLVGKQCEELIARLAQKARAAGIHLILATQRPSVDVITGLIKANIPARIAFQVSSRIDSRTIIDQQGAETLLGNGDMLYQPPGASIPQRVHGAFIDDHEVNKVVDFLKLTGRAEYIEGILSDPTEPIPGLSEEASGVPEDETDVLYDEAVKIVVESRRASISYLQRRLRIGYNRAARMMDEMERQGFVSEPEGNGSREVLIAPHSEEPE